MDSITIAGHAFNVPSRYSEGHVLTANEAAALNQTFHENLRNNFAKTVKEAGETPDLADLQSKLDAYAESYQFGVRASSGPRAPVDPVGKEAFLIAREAVKAAIRRKGLNPSSYEAKQIAELAAAALEKNKDRFTEIAKQRIAEREAIAAGDLDVGQPEAAPAEKAPKAKRGRKQAEAA